MANKPIPITAYLPATAPEPPAELGAHGSKLWRDILSEWDIPDQASLAVLRQACSAFDRAETLHARIEEDGETIMLPGGSMKANPLLMVEISARSLVARLLGRLGLLDGEPKRGPGRPPRIGGAW
jgi:P27 family predicted phage terminase small subunit